MTERHLDPEEFSAAVSAITSAFGDPTRRRIYLFAREAAEGVTAGAVAERFDLHPNVARHHLDKLAAGGYLDVHADRASGGAGRPSKRYVAGAAADLDAPVRRDDLLAALLGRALDLLPPPVASAMAEEVGLEYGRALGAAMATGEGRRSFRVALQAVADALTAHGFAARTEGSRGSLTLVADHCPFGGVQSPVVCAVDRGMVRGMLQHLYGDTSPEITASRVLGHEACVTAFAAGR